MRRLGGGGGRKREYFVVMVADESHNFRPSTGYQLFVRIVLLPKECYSESAGILPFHFDLVFSDEAGQYCNAVRCC